ncbi:hypothetical protein PQR21_23740 [Paraburkholderia nemoris]|uniref:8-oxoguanine DNA glycosylase OGG fold protein n=1 Tax=Paraburkholderia nemoris TaxID=2793076 RepID=UPI0038B77A8C
MPVQIYEIPELYKRYRWCNRHGLWGYGADKFPHFEWINSLERRFSRIERAPSEAPIYLFREMIHWGGSQNGVLENFELQLGTYNFANSLEKVRSALDDPETAIAAALDIPGIGLSYASKLLRFLKPEIYGVLDRKILDFLKRSQTPFRKVRPSSKSSMVQGYAEFLELLSQLKTELEASQIWRPNESDDRLAWRAADVEMALFQRAVESPRRGTAHAVRLQE